MTDPPARRMNELSATEARQLFGRFRAEAPAGLEALLGTVRELDGPIDALDASLASLESLWPWFLSVATSMDANDASAGNPWWAAFHPPWAHALGHARAWLATGLAEYVSACIVAQSPRSRWVLGRRASNRRHPVLEIPGRGEMDYAVPIGFTVRALSGDLPADREAWALRRLAEIWLGLDAAHEAALAELGRPIGPWAIRAIDERRFTHELSFDDSTAHRSAARIGRLAAAIVREPEIDEAVHEDREVVLVRARGLTTEALIVIVKRLWEATERPHENPTRRVP